MYVIDKIAEYTGEIADWFYEVYLDIYDWVWPFYKAADWFYDLCYSTNKIKWRFEDFSEDMDAFVDDLEDILSWSNIRSLIRSWLPDVEDAIDWFTDRWYWFQDEISDWWNDKVNDVKDLIDTATEGLDNLLEAWDNFWRSTLPNLVNFTWLGIWWQSRLLEIDTLIGSWLASFAPFWEGWQEVRQEVVDFFADPYQWIYDRLDEFFERFW